MGQRFELLLSILPCEIETDSDVVTNEDKVGDCIVLVAMGDGMLGLPILDMEEVTLAIRDNEDVILVDLDIEEGRGDSVADDVEAGADPDTEDMESIICELSVLAASSMSISIIISLLIIPSSSPGWGSHHALDRDVALVNCRPGVVFCWCDPFFTPVIVLVCIDDYFVVVGDMILVWFSHRLGEILWIYKLS